MKNIFNILILCVLSIFVSCTRKPIIEEDTPDIEEHATLDDRIEAVVPHIRIHIENNAEVIDKEVYLNAEIEIDGHGKFQDLAKVKTTIKGRGNSTWFMPKKPYRLKLDKKASLFGLPEAKDWILLANYNDYTLMTNAVGMKIGKQLGMPFTNDIIPVDLTVNGVYRGNYNLTQQIEIKENRVNIGEGGVLWEMDSYFDELWKFKSPVLQLPMNLKDPDVESESQFALWRNEFQHFEHLLFAKEFPKNSYGEVFDKQQFVNFLIVNMLTGNHEVGHPKSVYMHKKLAGKYTMGPVWDFDYSFGFSEEHGMQYFNYENLNLIREDDTRIGAELYKRILKDPEVKLLFAKTWKTYKDTKFNELMDFIEVYAAEIRDSQKKDYELWKVGNNRHAENKAELKIFLRKRAKLLEDYIAKL